MLPLTQHAINFSAPEPLSVDENWALNFEREKYRREYHALMKERGVDVILCPAYISAGALVGAPKYWAYTSIWNILDQPGLTFPTGLSVDKNIDLVDLEYSPRSEIEKTEWQSCMYLKWPKECHLANICRFRRFTGRLSHIITACGEALSR